MNRVRRFMTPVALICGIVISSDVGSAQAYTPIQLGTLGGSFSEGWAINDLNQVAGVSNLPNGTTIHAFVTGPNGAGMTDLGTLGSRSSTAYGINSSGRVVGFQNLLSVGLRAFITGPNGAG
jgi:probable HAF family extracellular repeat protein